MAKSLKALYESLAQEREPYLDRARDAASLTIPSLFPEESFGSHDNFNDPFQSIGSQGINSLTSKLLVALFPPGLQFFEYQLDPLATASALLEERQAEVEAAVRQAEIRAKGVQFHIEQPTFRVRMKEAIDHLLVAGTVLLRRTKTGYRIHRLPSFTVDIDAEDNLLAIVTMETIRRDAAPPEVIAAAKTSNKTDLEVYTGWKRRPGTQTFDTYQEVDENRIAGTDAHYGLSNLPVHPARFDACCGSSYGRTMVERVIGDLASLEGLSQATVELGAESARLLWFISEGSTLTPANLANKPNGSYVSGNSEHVKPLTVEKLQDMRVVGEARIGIREDLKKAFFMVDSVRRDAERVTALEVQTLARDLDETQGGVYSSLSVELQAPVLRMEESALVRAGKLPAIKESDPIKAKIVAGIEGLGRGIELRQLGLFLGAIGSIPPEEATGFEVNRRKIIERFAKATGVGSDVLRKVADSQQMRQAAVQQAQLAAAGPELTRQVGGVIRENPVPQNGAA